VNTGNGRGDPRRDGDLIAPVGERNDVANPAGPVQLDHFFSSILYRRRATRSIITQYLQFH
jgi:hypothetical protein